MKKGFNLYPFTPLLLLLFLFISPWAATNLSSIATHSSTTALADKFALPLVGFSTGAVIFLFLINGRFQRTIDWLYAMADNREYSLTFALATIQAILFACLPILRYNSLHANLFDLGIELSKLWLVAETGILNLFSQSARFQPLLSLYGTLYKLINSPLPFLALQPLVTTSAVIPLYLLAKKKLNTPLFTLALVIIFLYYPPVQYNSFNDLHLDHLYIPFMLWAFYFAEQEKYPLAILFITLICLIKEPLILGAAFFGLYLALGKKKYLMGVMVFIAFLVMFYLVTFVMLPKVSAITPPGESVIQSANYHYLLTSHKQFFVPLIKEAVKLRKLVYLLFLLLPLLFLPCLSLPAFLPALPLIAVSILSTNPLHASVNGHYTVGIIPPAFTALILTLTKLRQRWGDKAVAASLGWIIVLTLSFNIAHSPAPISVNFWDKEGAGGIYHYSQYQQGKHEKILAQVINELIPPDPEIKIVCHSKIAHERLSSRYFFRSFPQDWEQADYILLDHSRLPMLFDKIDKQAYWQMVEQVEQSGYFKKIFNQDGIVLYARELNNG